MSVESTSPVFALDIGTRSVVGLIMKKYEGTYTMLDVDIQEHGERSMLDGQIHHVGAVSEVIQSVKLRLEERHGPLKRVCVAAAGRSLKTKRIKKSLDISGDDRVTKNDILHLELQAVQHAQHELAQDYKDDRRLDYHCVGYSVVEYLLDDAPIGSLEDQSGQTAVVDVIATFLPKVVVESLLTALKRANLELEALTLEPIAAINVLIPPSMRRLNVALVDIGAGTSDIAITNEGTVVAYGMVPVAGDEVTEALSDQFLLDFPDAEQVKRQLNEKDHIQIEDILGMETEMSREEGLEPIRPVIKNIASEIRNEILSLNGNAPRAVMLVGGGSLTPEIGPYLAESLQLPTNRVAVRGVEAIKHLQPNNMISSGPELITPVGIAIAAKEHPVEYLRVTVNDQSVRLFDVKQLRVGDALLASGLDLKELHGKPGTGMVVHLNSQMISIPGQKGEAPALRINGKPARVDDPISEGDHIDVEQGENGQDAQATIAELIDEWPVTAVTINEISYDIQQSVKRNHQLVQPDTWIHDGDHIWVESAITVSKALQTAGYTNSLSSQPFNIYVNHQTIEFPEAKSQIKKNGICVMGNEKLQSGDELTIEEPSTTPTLKDLGHVLNEDPVSSVTITLNEKPFTVEKKRISFYRDQRDELQEHDHLHHGESITMERHDEEPIVIQDIFKHIDWSFQRQAKQKLILRKNGYDTSFLEPLMDGDDVELRIEP